VGVGARRRRGCIAAPHRRHLIDEIEEDTVAERAACDFLVSGFLTLVAIEVRVAVAKPLMPSDFL
jgi:hypothetical protein